MIHLNLSAETVKDLHEQMVGLLAGASIPAGAGIAQPAEEPAPKKGRGKKAEEVQPPTAPSAEGNAGTTSNEGAISPETQSSAADSGPVTKETVQAKCLQLSQKAGPPALAEFLNEFGGKKFTDIGEDKYPAMSVRLDELLAA